MKGKDNKIEQKKTLKTQRTADFIKQREDQASDKNEQVNIEKAQDLLNQF